MRIFSARVGVFMCLHVITVLVALFICIMGAVNPTLVTSYFAFPIFALFMWINYKLSGHITNKWFKEQQSE